MKLKKATPIAMAFWAISATGAHTAVANDNLPVTASKPKYYIEEYILLRPEKIDWFIEYYEAKIVPVIRNCPGYAGWSISSYRPEGTKGLDQPDGEENAAWSVLGPPDDIFIDHAGARYDEKYRTNSSVNLHSLLKPAFNLLMQHYFYEFEDVANLNNCFTQKWEEMYGVDAWDDLADNYFTHVRNHWDTVYRYEIIRGGYEDGVVHKGMQGHTKPE